jgi:hypothetical protein
MKILAILFSYLTLGLLLLPSCTPMETATLFVPNIPTHHLMTHKGDYRVGAGFQLTPTFSQSYITGEVQGAYSPIKHLTVLGNYSYMNAKNGEENENFDRRRKQSFGEFGLGTYFTSQTSERLTSVVELIGGYGVGKATDVQSTSSTTGLGTIVSEDRFTANSRRFFGQFNWGFKYAANTSFRIQVGPSLRISRIETYRVSHVSNTQTIPLENPKFTMFDFGVHMAIGDETVQFMTQTIFSGFPSEGDEEVFREYVDGTGAFLHLVVGIKTKF